MPVVGKSHHVKHHGDLEKYSDSRSKIKGLKFAIGYLFKSIEYDRDVHNPAFPLGFGVSAKNGDVCKISGSDRNGYLIIFDGAIDEVKNKMVRHRIIKRLEYAIPGLKFDEIGGSVPMEFKISGLGDEKVLDSMASFNKTMGQPLFVAEFLTSVLRDVAETGSIGRDVVSIKYDDSRKSLAISLDSNKINSKPNNDLGSALNGLTSKVFTQHFVSNLNDAFAANNNEAEGRVAEALKSGNNEYSKLARSKTLAIVGGSDLMRLYENGIIGDYIADMYALCSLDQSKEIRDHVMDSLQGLSDVHTSKLPVNLFDPNINLSMSEDGKNYAVIKFWMRLIQKDWVKPWDGDRKSIEGDAIIKDCLMNGEISDRDRIFFISGKKATDQRDRKEDRALKRTAKNFKTYIFAKEERDFGHIKRARLQAEIGSWLNERLGMEGVRAVEADVRRRSTSGYQLPELAKPTVSVTPGVGGGQREYSYDDFPVGLEGNDSDLASDPSEKYAGSLSAASTEGAGSAQLLSAKSDGHSIAGVVSEAVHELGRSRLDASLKAAHDLLQGRNAGAVGSSSSGQGGGSKGAGTGDSESISADLLRGIGAKKGLTKAEIIKKIKGSEIELKFGKRGADPEVAKRFKEYLSQQPRPVIDSDSLGGKGSEDFGLIGLVKPEGNHYFSQFSGLHFRGIDFGEIDLFVSNFNRCTFENCDFSQVYNFRNIAFNGCDFTETDIPDYDSPVIGDGGRTKRGKVTYNEKDVNINAGVKFDTYYEKSSHVNSGPFLKRIAILQDPSAQKVDVQGKGKQETKTVLL